MRRSLRVPIAAAVLLLVAGSLCAAWYVSSQRALAAEQREREQRAIRATAEREAEIAASLTKRLEELRRDESQRPYFHYQNLYHDPKGVSQGLSVVPSPLASGPTHPLVAAHFQIDAARHVTLPTLNEEVRKLSAPNAPEQMAVRDTIRDAAAEVQSAAKPLLRLAALEASVPPVPTAPPARPAIKEAKVEVLSPMAFQQNVASNELYVQLEQNRTPVTRPVPAEPVEIRTTDLEWKTVTVEGKPRLVAVRGVHTPAGLLVQGILTPLADGSLLDGATVRFASGKGSSIEGTGWRVMVDPAELLAASRRDDASARQRFLRTFPVVAGLLTLGVAGVVWMLARSESLAIQKSRFAATAAHELRTPLASLRLYSEMIAEERDPEKRERYAREIAGQTERLGRVVANVLEVTRIERGTFALRPQQGEIGRAVEDCISKLRPGLEAAGCPIDLSVAPGLPPVAFDADALHHIVDNLVDNAEKYSRQSPSRAIDVAVAPEDGGVAITISDRGPGLPDALVRAPRPFRRGAADGSEGLGLGLFLVDRIVRGHGGAMRSDARPGGGTSVRVWLPAFYTA